MSVQVVFLHVEFTFIVILFDYCSIKCSFIGFSMKKCWESLTCGWLKYSVSGPQCFSCYTPEANRWILGNSSLYASKCHEHKDLSLSSSSFFYFVFPTTAGWISDQPKQKELLLLQWMFTSLLSTYNNLTHSDAAEANRRHFKADLLCSLLES